MQRTLAQKGHILVSGVHSVCVFPSSSKYSRDLLKHQDPESSPVSLLSLAPGG